MTDSIVRIGYGADFAPFTHTTPLGAAGELVELVRTAFARTRFSVHFIETASDDLAAALARGAIDAFAGVAKTRARSSQYRFSATLRTTGGAWFTLLERNVPELEAWDDAAVVATPGAGPLTSIIRKQFPRLSVMETPDYHRALASVADGRALAAALNFDVGRLHSQRDFAGLFRLPQTMFCTLPLTLAVPRSRASPFMRAFNAAVRDIYAPGQTFRP